MPETILRDRKTGRGFLEDIQPKPPPAQTGQLSPRVKLQRRSSPAHEKDRFEIRPQPETYTAPRQAALRYRVSLEIQLGKALAANAAAQSQEATGQATRQRSFLPRPVVDRYTAPDARRRGRPRG